MLTSLRFVLLCLIMLSLAGCAAEPLLEGAAKTTVSVTLDGQPVEDAAVVFTPVGGGRSGVGRTDAQGIAKMGTSNYADGVFPGEYKIVVVKSIDDPSSAPSPAEDQHEVQGRGRPVYAKQLYLVPEKYISTSTSGLSTIVEAGVENEVTLDLTSDQ